MKKHKMRIIALSIALVTGIIIGILSTITIIAIRDNNTTPEVMGWKTLYVSEGDSLWNISKAEYPQEYDIEMIIDLIKDHNNINSYLYPGTIEIPIFDPYEAGYLAGISFNESH